LTTPLIDTSVAIASDASYRFSVGDHDLDGVPDLYAVSGSSPATVQVAHGGSGFTSGPTSIATGVTLAADETLTVEDYDGDGRDDLYLVGADGALRVILGGVRAGGADLDGWFVKVDLSWGWGTGCVQPAYLRIVTDPPVASQILIDGQPADTWGLTWLKLPPGTYEVSFRDLEGFTTPGAATVTVSEGATTAHTGTFAQRGFLRVLTDPPVPATISVDGTPRNDWGMWTDLVPGTYQVCFGGVEDFTPPACEEAIVSAGDTTTITGTYTAAPGTAGPTDYGWLRVVTNPPVPSQIIVDGIARDTWGLNWLKVPPGTYDVSFSDLEGFTTPTPQTVDVVSGTTTAVQGDFIQRGWLRVLTSPPVVGTVLVDGVPRNDWGLWTDFEPGTYEVCFGAVSGLTAPNCQSAVVAAGDTVTITGVYE
jgi:hypothetical protein